VQLKYDVSEDDYLAFCNYYYARTRAGRGGMYRMYVIAACLFLLFAYSKLNDPTYGVQNPLFYTSYLATTAFIFGALYFAYIKLVRPAIIRWASKTTDFKEMLGKVELEWDESQVAIVKEGGRGKLPWRGIRQLAEDKRHFYMITSPLRAFIIPKSAFASEEEAQREWKTALQYHAQAKKGS